MGMNEISPNNFTSTCKCGAPLVWILTKNRKRNPVEAKPEKRFVFNPLTGLYDLKESWKSHFEECPLADKFRKKGRSAQQTMNLGG